MSKKKYLKEEIMSKKLGLILIILMSISIFSCGVGTGSSSSASSISIGASSSSSASIGSGLQLKLKNYIGAASIGDIVWYGIDHSNKQLIFSNISRQYTWSSTYSEESDGTCKFTIPVIDVTAYFFEIPDKMLVVNFYIRENNTNIPAFAILVPHLIQSEADLTNLKGTYCLLETKRSVKNDFTYGLHEGELDVLSLSSTVITQYYVSNNMTYVKHTLPVKFSNEIKSPYVEAPSWEDGKYVTNNYVFFASDTTFVVDMGIGRGFIVGLKIRTSSFTANDIAGRALFMKFEQHRNANKTNYYSYLDKGYANFSNNNNNLDNWVNGTNFVGQFNILSLQHEGKSIYYMAITNYEVYAPISEDLSCALIYSKRGDMFDLEQEYVFSFGFAKVKQ